MRCYHKNNYHRELSIAIINFNCSVSHKTFTVLRVCANLKKQSAFLLYVILYFTYPIKTQVEGSHGVYRYQELYCE